LDLGLVLVRVLGHVTRILR